MPIYMKYGEIKGDVDEPAHRGWIELGSAQFGVHKRSAGDGTAPPSVSEIFVTKSTDNASSGLFRESVAGKGVTAFIDFVKDDGSVYLRLTLTNTLIASYSISGQGERPTETLTLNFTKIEFKQTPGDPPP